MSQRKEKRARKILRDEIKKYQADTRQLITENAKIIKPKPKWMPMRVWMWMLGFFINLRK